MRERTEKIARLTVGPIDAMAVTFGITVVISPHTGYQAARSYYKKGASTQCMALLFWLILNSGMASYLIPPLAGPGDLSVYAVLDCKLAPPPPIHPTPQACVRTLPRWFKALLIIGHRLRDLRT